MRSLVVLMSVLGMAAAGAQTVAVRGTLMCGSAPLADAEVKLWELDTWPDPDDVLATTKTDKNGRFEVFGTDSEIGTIKPVVKFYHRCNNKGLFNLPAVCKRKNTFEIPSSYINKGQNAGKWYEIGTMNVEAKARGEGTECI